jgi:hypothetical protein
MMTRRSAIVISTFRSIPAPSITTGKELSQIAPACVDARDGDRARGTGTGQARQGVVREWRPGAGSSGQRTANGCARDAESFRPSAGLVRRGCHGRRNLRLRL